MVDFMIVVSQIGEYCHCEEYPVLPSLDHPGSLVDVQGQRFCLPNTNLTSPGFLEIIP